MATVHELSIAQAVAEVAGRHARGRRVERVIVRVGRLRQVVPSALTFAFELVVRETELEGAVLEIDDVPAVVRCRPCGREGPLDAFPALCAACGSLEVDVVRGEELEVEALDVDDGEPAAEPAAPLGSNRSEP